MTRPARAERPRRRTQAERSAETRERVLHAVVDCIVEEGLQNTTAARIVERSGVTWGAIAHQFGDKESLLLDAAGRVSLLVDETWRRMIEPASRAFLEIVLSSRAGSDTDRKGRQEQTIIDATRRIWIDLFAEFGVDSKTIDTVRKLTFATIIGMALQGMMAPRMPRYTQELEILKRGALRELGLDDPA